jgi:heme/copper-type cytochrome/quinol oxidase subunit 2
MTSNIFQGILNLIYNSLLAITGVVVVIVIIVVGIILFRARKRKVTKDDN